MTECTGTCSGGITSTSSSVVVSSSSSISGTTEHKRIENAKHIAVIRTNTAIIVDMHITPVGHVHVNKRLRRLVQLYQQVVARSVENRSMQLLRMKDLAQVYIIRYKTQSM